MEAIKERPPYVMFELRAVEDRQASIAAGHFVAKDVAYAIITPPGSKDRIERVASEWLTHLKEQVAQERFPRDWYVAFNGAFKDWQEGREPAVDGTDVRNWPGLSPAQTRTLLDLKIRTVEQLATANEETLSRLGMGGRALKDRAEIWLRHATQGIPAEALAAQQVRIADLQASVSRLTEQNARMAAQLAALVPAPAAAAAPAFTPL